MSSIENLRPLQPLFASIIPTFADFSKRIKEGFWNLGTNLLNEAHKGTLFDPTVKLHGPDDEEDNFDIIMDTAEKFSILLPILRPKIVAPMMEEIRSHCEQVLRQTLITFYPAVKKREENKSPPAKTKPAAEVPAWLKKWVPEESENVEEAASNPADSDPEDGAIVPVQPIKRRLKRCNSDYDKGTKTHRERNHVRNALTRMFA